MTGATGPTGPITAIPSKQFLGGESINVGLSLTTGEYHTVEFNSISTQHGSDIIASSTTDLDTITLVQGHTYLVAYNIMVKLTLKDDPTNDTANTSDSGYTPSVDYLSAIFAGFYLNGSAISSSAQSATAYDMNSVSAFDIINVPPVTASSLQ